jgi:hypothetical protein
VSTLADLRAALDPAFLFERAYRVEPLDWQRDYLRATGNVVVLKGRQIGASTAAALLAIATTVYAPGVNAIVVSPSLQQSQEIAAKARLGLENLGVPLQKDSSSTIGLRNGSRIVSLPGTARSVRGWTARLLIIDEAAFVLDETFAAARALVATGGRLIVQSTPADERGAFHEICTGEEACWTRLTVRSDQVPTITAEFLAAERRGMSPDTFAKEFECQFGRPSSHLFSSEKLARLFPASA